LDQRTLLFRGGSTADLQVSLMSGAVAFMTGGEWGTTESESASHIWRDSLK